MHRAEGFTFDMGPTVLTVPHFIKALFALERDKAMPGEPDFPAGIMDESRRMTSGNSGGTHASRYDTLRPIVPSCRIFFDDGS